MSEGDILSMAKKKKTASDGNGAEKKPAAKKPAAAATPVEGAAPDATDAEAAQFGILAQFIKDLSFESPNAPMSLQAPGDNPKLDINIQVQVARHTDEIYEVDLAFNAKAESEAGVIYNVELVYGSMFQASGIPDEYVMQVLYVDAPTIVFPFMRRVIADITSDGGFQPLMLEPIDFGGLFQQNADNASIQDLRATN
jgi:preprotein translocase subunit SecB